MVNKIQYFKSQQKRSKYGNKKCEYKGEKFDSVKERDRFIYLESCESKGLISNLQRQVEFVLIPDEYKKVIEHLKTKDKVVRKRTFIGVRYRADFVYYKDGVRIVEDVKSTVKAGEMRKGAVDDVFFIKYKMLHSLLGIDLKIVDSATAPL